jgi:hypothetical protein
MSSRQDADDLAAKAADAVRRVVADAEERAAEILRDAEAKAASVREQAEADSSRIRERAEADARGQIEAAKRALDELGGTLVAAATEAIPKAETQEPEPQPEPEPELVPEPQPGNGDDAAARLVAMKLAVDGTDRAEIEGQLNEKFGPADRSALLDDVLSRAAR